MAGTTIALSESTYDSLQDVRHRLEKKKHRNYSFDKTIQHLIKKEEKNGR